MKALSLTRPWGLLAVLGEKIWETRPRRLNHFGELAIQSSDGFPKELLKSFPGGLDEVFHLPFFNEALLRHGYDSPALLPAKAIVGVVDVIRYERTEAIRDSLPDKEIVFGVYSDGRWAYELANPRKIELIHCSGKQGLWNVPLDVERQIREQLAGEQVIQGQQ